MHDRQASQETCCVHLHGWWRAIHKINIRAKYWKKRKFAHAEARRDTCKPSSAIYLTLDCHPAYHVIVLLEEGIVALVPFAHGAMQVGI